MKQFASFFVFVVSFFSLFGGQASAQSHDLNVWSVAKNPGSTYLWYVYYGDKIVVDLRHNYDDINTVGGCLGKNLLSSESSVGIVPEFCGYAGRTKGYGPEVLAYVETERFAMFSQSQYVKGVRGSTDSLYNWTDVHILAKRVGIGAGAQAFKEVGGAQATIDVGPDVQIQISKSAKVRVWPNWSVNSADRGSKSVWFGVGFVF